MFFSILHFLLPFTHSFPIPCQKSTFHRIDTPIFPPFLCNPFPSSIYPVNLLPIHPKSSIKHPFLLPIPHHTLFLREILPSLNKTHSPISPSLISNPIHSSIPSNTSQSPISTYFPIPVLSPIFPIPSPFPPWGIAVPGQRWGRA